MPDAARLESVRGPTGAPWAGRRACTTTHSAGLPIRVSRTIFRLSVRIVATVPYLVAGWNLRPPSRGRVLQPRSRVMSSFDRPRQPFARRTQDNATSRPFRPNRPAPGASQPVTGLRGQVKWYNPDKGFGFVALEDGTDAFLHASVLGRAGVSVGPGDTVQVAVVQGLKGKQVTELALLQSAPAPVERRSPHAMPRQPSEPSRQSATSDRLTGTIKWWNQQKGFGFITPEAGTQDIFVSAATAERSGLQLAPGMPVRVKVRQGEKGPLAVEIAAA